MNHNKRVEINIVGFYGDTVLSDRYFYSQTVAIQNCIGYSF